MSIIIGALYVVYVVVCLGLIFLVLLQQSKGGGLAGAFGGGGGSETMFGYTQMQKIGRMTIGCAILFMALSILIANLPHEPKVADSVVDFGNQVPVTAPAGDAGTQPAPAEGAPAAPPAAPEVPAPQPGQ